MSGPNTSGQRPTHDEKLDWFRKYFRPQFDSWVIGPIDRLVHSDDALVGFILMACAIDYLAGFWWGKSTSGKVRLAYTGFVKRYFPPRSYDPDGVYDSLRNGLVHMFTIKAKKYALTHNNAHLHLKEDSAGQLLLNAENFRNDLVSAKEKYFSEIEADPDLLDKLLLRYERDGFLDLQSWETA